MSILIVDPLFNGVTFEQKIKVSRDVSVRHVRPWVYLQGTLGDGTFQCRVLQGATPLVTSTIDYTLVNAGKDETYAHGYIRFDFDSLILHRAEGEEDTEYTLEFTMQGHTTDANNFLGIVREWDSKSAIIYGDIDGNGDPVNDAVAPAGYQIYEYRK